MALEGCSTSHHSPPDMPDSALPDAPGFDAGSPDAGPPPFDGGRPSVDAGPPPFDGGSPNIDAGNDAGTDAGPVTDPRLCEPGWPTTKATRCEPVDPEDAESARICYNPWFCEEVENEDGELVQECRDWEEADGGCLLPRPE